ncbi:nucleoprotein TPR-like [Helianthus annuus]|uniref:nucleoprotein TPR-like n=1 Tax=Helianthus annuus TaxID=4232 RepID=UPI000B8F9F8F|nr:nucleoprotein TPR-like [Helianthus annuus]
MAPTTADPIAKWRKNKDTATKKRKGSDDDASYEPSAIDLKKMKKERESTTERVETSTVETPIVESTEIPILTSPRSPFLQTMQVHSEEVLLTPPQQHQSVLEPESTTKRASMQRKFDHEAEFNATFDESVEARLSKFEQEKAASDDKLKNVDAENVVLKNEVLVLNERVTNLEASNVVVNEVVQGLVTTNENLSSSNTSLNAKKEILKKMVEDHEAYKEIKLKQLEKLYAMIEDKLGEPKNDDENKEDEDEEEDDSIFDDIDNYHANDDNRDDEDDQDNTGMMVVKYSGVHQVLDYLDDTQNEERMDVNPHGEKRSGATHDESAGSFTEAKPINSVPTETLKIIYICHDVEDGEIVHNYTREEMMEMLGVDDENFKFDFEEDLGKTSPEGDYVFKMVDEVDNFDNVVMEDDSESDKDEPFHYSSKDSEDFLTFTELFSKHNEEDLRRRVEERVRDEGIPRTLTREELIEERKKWFKPMLEERKFKRPLKFFTRHQDQSLGPKDVILVGH